MSVSTAGAVAVFAASLVLLLARPRRIPEWTAALGGGLLMVVIGAVPVSAAVSQLVSSWNVFLFFLGLGLSAATADRAGVFRAAAEAAARVGGGSQPGLLISLYMAGVVVTAVLSNDATALLMTPVAFAVTTRLGLDPRPYAFACALVANAASFLLPVSNPANLLVLSRAPLPLYAFLGRLLLPSILAISLTLAGLLWIFRAELAAPFAIPSGASVQLARRTVVGAIGVIGLAVLYVVASAVSWPLGLVALVGALVLVALDTAVAGWHPGALFDEMPWSLFPLLAGLLLLVDGAERAGLFGRLIEAVAASIQLGGAGLPLVMFGMAALANVLNNLPAALVASSALGSLSAGAARSDLAAAIIVGVNLGPNLTTIGSLATMLWLVLMRRRGVEVSALSYLRVGVVATLPALVGAAAGLWLTAQLHIGA